MNKNIWFSILLLVSTQAFAVTGSIYPSYILKNQYGETSINSLVGGSGALDCVFTVASTDVAGKGITNLRGPACASVFMATNQTPAAGNPNPESGIAVVNLKSNFYQLNSVTYTVSPPTDLSPINVTAGLSFGSPYIISQVGTTTVAQWQHIGLSPGIVPAVGAAFIAAGFSTTSGTGTVDGPGDPGAAAADMDVIGNASLGGAATAGGQIIVRFFNGGTINPPDDGSTIDLHFVLLPLSNQLH